MLSPDAIGIMVVISAQAGVLLFWGGQTHQILKDHERRISKLEDSDV